jgi:hypothetical protein
MSLEQLEVNQKEATTPEMLGKLEAQYEQEVAALRRDIETDLAEASKIKDEKTKSTAFGRYGILSIESANIDQKVINGLNKIIS